MAVKALYMSNGDLGLARAQLAKLLPKLFEADNEKVRQRIEQRHVRKEEDKVLSDYLDDRNYKQLPPLTDVAKVELLREMGSDPNVDASAPAFQTEKKWWWAGGDVAPEHPRELVHHRLRTSFEEATGGANQNLIHQRRRQYLERLDARAKERESAGGTNWGKVSSRPSLTLDPNAPKKIGFLAGGASPKPPGFASSTKKRGNAGVMSSKSAPELGPMRY